MSDTPTPRSTPSAAITTPSAPQVGTERRTTIRAPGYEIGPVLGRGGMGEVVLAKDRRIGREVALKRLLVNEPTGDEVARFLREARIQARLDHPAVVPVFELGYDAEGHPYFTMKRLTGTTLRELLSDPSVSLQRLLRAYVDVCLAIDLAHAKQVVHRDLKPANVMLGNYGEVYVLDWGIAQVIDVGEDSALAELASFQREGRGTPGYMAPEQAFGAVSTAADVYSLGCILFEILVREPMVSRDTEAPTQYAGPYVDSPARRFPQRNVPPELDALCSAATAASSSDRPTARALADGVQRYLDGDRDVELRRAFAVTELRHARAALAAGDHALAIQAGGAALALDPTSRDAAALVSQLMLQPPEVAPPVLIEDLAAADAADVRRHARRAAFAYLAVVALVPLAMWNGIENWTLVIAACALALTLSIFAWRLVVKPRRSLLVMTLYAAGNATLIGVLTRVLGPFVLVPAIACLLAASLTAYPMFGRRTALLVSVIALGWATPIALELGGWLAPTWSIDSHGILSYSPVLTLHGATTSMLIFAVCLVVIVIAGYLAGSTAVGHLDARRHLVRQAWQLRQLLTPLDRASQPPER